MRNLRIVSLDAVAIDGELPLTATAWDTSNDSIICAFGPTPSKPIIELKRKAKDDRSDRDEDNAPTSKLSPITSWDAPCPLPDLECDEILLMHYFPDTLTICLVLAGGDLILVREEPEDGHDRIEIVGSIDVGIAAAAWAPDEELLVVVTKSDGLVLMSRDLEPVTESTMTAEDLQASNHVSVGWGKKETQFKGKRAKAMRDPTIPEQVDEGLSSPLEDGKVRIAWRGDGAYFAVNGVIPLHRRVIRVYSRECVLDSVSEPVDGLESAISWRPAGNLIAGIRRSSKENQTKLEVVFFERNGLRHGEVPLRLKAFECDTIGQHISLAWNLDSTVLAVSLMGVVQYWTMGNYHYYLKQEIRTTEGTAAGPAKISWHPEKSLRCCAADSNSLLDIECLASVTRGSTIQPDDYGIAAVIDGASLKFTPLKHAGIPPPMAFCETDADSAIIDVAICKNGARLALLTATGVEIWDWELRTADKRSQKPELRHTTDVRKYPFTWEKLGISLSKDTCWTQIIFTGNDNLYILAPGQRGSGPLCFRLTLQVQTLSERGIALESPKVDRQEVPYAAQSLLSDVEQTCAWVQYEGMTAQIKGPFTVEDSTIIELVGSQPNSTIFRSIPASEHGSANGFHSSFHKVSLTSKGSLVVDQRVLAKDCTSFVVTDLHLIYTTAQHLLKFVHLTTPDQMEIPGDTPEVDERCRSIERGAKIVTVAPSIYAVILQMPRGNLETIYPRVLVLTGIRESLRRLDYRAAFVACQNHQVDMNIIYDYMPSSFMANINKFINGLKKPSRVDEFLSKMKEEDVTQTLYKDTLSIAEEKGRAAVSMSNSSTSQTYGVEVNKVNTICDTFISALKDKPGNFLQCIITAHVCKRPPDLSAALSLVSSLRQVSAKEADDAVSHLCFLTDANRLFDAALSLYDLEVALLVAQNAQRDPREYMPFLQNLQNLPTFRRQYQIDNHLHNYDKALTSLHALEAFDEVEMYTIKHSLYINAMNLYKYSPAQLSRITILYAEHLSSQSQHSAAATLYESLGQYDQAYAFYALAHKWREALTCATLVPLEPSQLRQLASSLATNLSDESRDYRSAATIHTEYLSDPSTAARLLCKGSYFAEATRVLSIHKLSTDIPTTIDTGLGDKFSEILELVSDCKAQLTAQVPRIQELRVKKAEDPLAFYGGDAAAAAADGIDIPDNISLAPTDATTAGGQSLFTRYGGSQGSKFAGTVASNVSRKTSKTKRREERKRARGKKGSVYEEEYLVGSVGRLIDRVNGVHDEVARLVSGLMRRGMRERTIKVGEVMNEVVAACEKAKVDVWGASEIDKKESGDRAEGDGQGGEGDWKPSGADGVFWDSQVGVGKKEAPVVKTWTGLGWL